VHSSSAPKPEHTIALFREVEPKPSEIKQAVLDRMPPGMSAEEAQAVLESQGFKCRPFTRYAQAFHPEELVPAGVRLSPDATKRLVKEQKHTPVYCRITLPELQEWHLMSYQVLVVLIPDESKALSDIEVGVQSIPHMHRYFFVARKPDLHEPTGLSVDAACARMEAAGFRCKTVVAKAGDKEQRPHVLCEAFDENPIGGKIIRVQLFPDEAGMIRETRVVEREELFDAERCMLPHGDESPAEAVCRGVLFPVRAGVRYTLFAVAIGMAITAMPYGLH
jgi:hypothetical protein